MKKIIFVEKEDASYDPVATFFNKKAPSVPKSINSATKTSNIKPNTDKKISSEVEKPQKPSIIKKEDEITPKIGKKGQYQVPNIPKPYPLKEQVLKSREVGRSNAKKQSKSNILKEQIPKIPSQKDLKQVSKEDSIEKMKEQQVIKPIKKDKVQASKTQSLSKRVKELEERQLQFQRKIEQLQAKEQKYAKNEQKLSKMQKDFKAMTLKSRQGEAALQKLKERQAQIKQMLEGNAIPFTRKREVILNNKIRQLKRLNKELILRIKNYKGSDLVDLSVQQNRQQITKDLYTVDVQKELTAEMNIEMELLLVQLINKLKLYMDNRIKEKGERISWSNQQKFLLQISNLSEKISLNYLNNYDISALPKSNEEAVSVYSILEQYKKCNQMAKVVDRFSLNFNLSKENMQILQGLDQMNTQSLKLKSEIGRAKNRREDVGKLKECLNMFEKRSSFLQILLIQNICQMQYLRDWLQKATGRVSSQLTSTLRQLQEIKNIVELGPSAKQSLFLYLETNLQKLSTRFTNLRHQVKHIQVDFKQIQSCPSSK